MLTRARILFATLRSRRRHRTAGDDVDHADPGRPHRGGARDGPVGHAAGAARPGPQARLRRRRGRHPELPLPPPARPRPVDAVRPDLGNEVRQPDVERQRHRSARLPNASRHRGAVHRRASSGDRVLAVQHVEPLGLARAERADPRPFDRSCPRDQAQPHREVPAPELPRLPVLHRHRVARPGVVHALRRAARRRSRTSPGGRRTTAAGTATGGRARRTAASGTTRRTRRTASPRSAARSSLPRATRSKDRSTRTTSS